MEKGRDKDHVERGRVRTVRVQGKSWKLERLEMGGEKEWWA